MNIFLHELKSYRKSIIIWTVSMVALAVLYISLYASLYNEIDQFKKVIENYPEGLRAALGLTMENLSTVMGFYSMAIGYVILCGAIQAMNLGTSVISREIREKTADFLLTKPVSRVRILTAKLAGVFSVIFITNIIYVILTTIIAVAINPRGLNLKLLTMVSATLLFVQLIFVSLGVMVSVIFPKIKSVISVSLCTVFSFFIVNMLGSAIGEESVRYITPFKYYDPVYIIKNSAYELRFIIIELVFIIAAIAVSFHLYLKKDIHAV